MLHKLSMAIPLKQVEVAIEKLNIHGFYNTYYDQPIERFSEGENHGYHELTEVEVDLMLIIEETDTECVDVEKMKCEISRILQKNPSEITYHQLDQEDW